jgi:hypothetical protein
MLMERTGTNWTFKAYTKAGKLMATCAQSLNNHQLRQGGLPCWVRACPRRAGCLRGGGGLRRRGGIAHRRAPQLPAMPGVAGPFAPAPARVALGRQVFFDTRLSEPAGTSCASCHDPRRRSPATTARASAWRWAAGPTSSACATCRPCCTRPTCRRCSSTRTTTRPRRRPSAACSRTAAPTRRGTGAPSAARSARDAQRAARRGAPASCARRRTRTAFQRDVRCAGVRHDGEYAFAALGAAMEKLPAKPRDGAVLVALRRVGAGQSETHAAGTARPEAVQEPGQGQLRQLPQVQRDVEQSGPLAVHGLRLRRHRRAAQPRHPRQHAMHATSTRACAPTAAAKGWPDQRPVVRLLPHAEPAQRRGARALHAQRRVLRRCATPSRSTPPARSSRNAGTGGQSCSTTCRRATGATSTCHAAVQPPQGDAAGARRRARSMRSSPSCARLTDAPWVDRMRP